MPALPARGTKVQNDVESCSIRIKKDTILSFKAVAPKGSTKGGPAGFYSQVQAAQAPPPTPDAA